MLYQYNGDTNDLPMMTKNIYVYWEGKELAEAKVVTMTTNIFMCIHVHVYLSLGILS